MMMMMMMKMKIVALIFPGRSLHLGQMILAVGSPSSGTKRKDRRIATPMNKRHSSSALGSSATGRSKRLYLTNDDDDDDSEDLCVAEVSGCATTHDNARNKHCR